MTTCNVEKVLNHWRGDGIDKSSKRGIKKLIRDEKRKKFASFPTKSLGGKGPTRPPRLLFTICVGDGDLSIMA